MRFLRYSLVGALGLAVKFSMLAALIELAQVGHLTATALAVEATVLYNFTWHLRWTWSDRSAGLSPSEVLVRLWRFHAANGAVGLISNLLVMRLLVDGLGLHYFPANLAATAAAGMANLTLSELVVFTAPRRAGLKPATDPRVPACPA